jgi:glutathione synthase/RimK-type ligase-like ATP-grasp enzyme
MYKKVALLSMDSLENFYTYDKLLFEPMKTLGWIAEEISWRNETVDWKDFDAVVVRSTWDYQNDLEKFKSVLEKINSASHLENDFDLMKWNMNKNYLFDLEQKGVRIVETIWENKFNSSLAHEYFNKLNTDEIIIKPNVSASADNTFRLSKENINEHLPKLENIFATREFMVQPFLKNIIDEGEYSLFYFDGKFSHSVLKKPKEKDFRVQEEHGGDIQPFKVSAEMKDIGENILKKLSTIPLYGRVDLVRIEQNEFALMELELIEPSLYLNKDEQSPARLAKAFDERLSKIAV